MRSIIFSAAAIAAIALPAQAEQSAASAAAKGRITPFAVQVVAAPAAPARQIAAKAGSLVDRVLATPTLHQPRGFSLTRSVKVEGPPPGLSPDHPLIAEVTMIAQDIDLESGAKPDASGAYMGRLEGPTFRIGVNDMTKLYANVTWGDDDYAGAVQHLPIQRGEAQGFPVFRVGVRDVVLITKPGRKPWTHVGQGEHMEMLIAASRASEAEYPSAKGKANLDAQVAVLAALSPQQRAAPACVSSRLRVWLGNCAEPNATHYVRLNPAYFDKGLPKGAVQLVTISTPAEGGHGHKRLEPKFRAAAAELDYKAIQAALD